MLGASHPTRDFSFVTDTVAGFISAMNSSQAIGEVINLGSNFEISIEDTSKLISELMDKDVEFLVEAQRVRPSEARLSDFGPQCQGQEAARLVSEYEGHAGFRRGLTQTIEWFGQPRNLGAYKAELYNV